MDGIGSSETSSRRGTPASSRSTTTSRSRTSLSATPGSSARGAAGRPVRGRPWPFPIFRARTRRCRLFARCETPLCENASPNRGRGNRADTGDFSCVVRKILPPDEMRETVTVCPVRSRFRGSAHNTRVAGDARAHATRTRSSFARLSHVESSERRPRDARETAFATRRVVVRCGCASSGGQRESSQVRAREPLPRGFDARTRPPRFLRAHLRTRAAVLSPSRVSASALGPTNTRSDRDAPFRPHPQRG